MKMKSEVHEVHEESEVIKSSMNVILHAGDARNLICKAGEKIEDFAFDEAEFLLKRAQKELNAAHVLQTHYMQQEASGQSVEYCVLFTHAQDTLMTVVSEYNMTIQMLRIVKKIMKVIAGRKEGEIDE